MVEHIAEYPSSATARCSSGNPGDIVPEPLGEELPMIRDWTDAALRVPRLRRRLRPGAARRPRGAACGARLRPEEKVCVVSVGGSGVGESLLRRVIAAYPAAKEQVPELRMIVVAGPRIDPATLPATDGLEVRPYVHNLYRHLAACDLAVVQGGLTTGMELTANKRPFIYFPLEHHFEQRIHVA